LVVFDVFVPVRLEIGFLIFHALTWTGLVLNHRLCYAVWKRILKAVEELQRMERVAGGRLH
jgi:hypothetical protein